MPARSKLKSPPTPPSPMEPLFQAALLNLREKTKPIDLRPNDPVGWILEHFRIPREEREDMRLVLAPYQVKALQHAFTKDEDGLYRYSIILWSDIKKSIKSVIAAAVILWRAWHVDYSQIFIVANTLEQADSRVAYYLRRAIELNPELKRQCEISYSTHTVTLPNRTRIQAIPVNAAGQAGGNPMLVEYTELWGATTLEAERMWVETTIPPNLFGKSHRWIDTYAGFQGESKLLWQLYTTGVLNGVKFDPEYDFFYENRAARMFAIWNKRPRLSWQSDKYYISERAVLPPMQFSRVHENEWASASEQFVPDAWLAACKGEIPAYDKEPCVAAIDAGLSDDSFGVLVMDKKGDLTRIHYARAWYPPKGGEIDLEGTEDSPGPLREMKRLAKLHNIIEWAYDKTHIAFTMANLRKDEGFHVYDFSQGALRLVADKMLRDSIRDRAIVHMGEPDLVTHISNANAKIPPEGRQYLRIVKRDEDLKIDLAICASMANYELREAYTI